MKDRFVGLHLWSPPKAVETMRRGLGPSSEHVGTQSPNPLGITINANVTSLVPIGSSAL